MHSLRLSRGALSARAVLVVGALGGAIGSGCAPRPAPAALPALQLRASFDLGCPPQDVQLIHFDQRTKGVVGCGRRLIYVASCDDSFDRGACTWVLDSPPSVASSLAPSPPAAPRPEEPPPAVWPASTAPVGSAPPAASAPPWPGPAPPAPSSGPPANADLSRPDFGF